MNKNLELDMTSGPLLRKMIIFTIPVLLSGVLQLLFNAADIIVVGKFAGDNALAAVGSTTSLVNLLTNLFIGISAGANVAAANFFGSKDEEAVSETVHTSVLIGLIGGILLMAVGITFAEPILIWMDSPEAVLPLSTTYLKIFFWGTPALLLFNFCAAILRATGDTKHPLYYLIIAGILNVILNLFFVIKLNMSVRGVALATVISENVSMLLIVRQLMKAEGCIHLDLRKLRISKSKFTRIMRVGLPAGLQSSMFALSNVIIQSAINSFGEVVVAANTASSSVEGFVYTAMNSVYTAAMNFSGQCYGAGKYKRIHKVLFTSLSLVTIIALSLGGLMAVVGDNLLYIYTDNPDVVALAFDRLTLLCFTYFMCGWMDTIVGVMRGMGYGIIPMIVTLVGSCLFRIVWIYTVFVAHRSLLILYASWPISWIITFAMHVITYCLIWVRHRQEFLLKETAEPNL